MNTASCVVKKKKKKVVKRPLVVDCSIVALVPSVLDYHQLLHQ